MILSCREIRFPSAYMLGRPSKVLSGEYKQFGQLTDIEIEREGLPSMYVDGKRISRQDKIILLRHILSLDRGVSPIPISPRSWDRHPLLLMI
jgi:hypothetical protein